MNHQIRKMYQSCKFVFVHGITNRCRQSYEITCFQISKITDTTTNKNTTNVCARIICACIDRLYFTSLFIERGDIHWRFVRRTEPTDSSKNLLAQHQNYDFVSHIQCAHTLKSCICRTSASLLVENVGQEKIETSKRCKFLQKISF